MGCGMSSDRYGDGHYIPRVLPPLSRTSSRPPSYEASLTHPSLLMRLDKQVHQVECGSGDPESVVTLSVQFLEAVCNDLHSYFAGEFGFLVPEIRDAIVLSDRDMRRMNAESRIKHALRCLRFPYEAEALPTMRSLSALVSVRNRLTHPPINEGASFDGPKTPRLREWPKVVRSLVSLGVIPLPRNVRSTQCQELLAQDEVALWAAETALEAAALVMSMIPTMILCEHFSGGFTSYLRDGNTESALFAERALGAAPFSWLE